MEKVFKINLKPSPLVLTHRLIHNTINFESSGMTMLTNEKLKD